MARSGARRKPQRKPGQSSSRRVSTTPRSTPRHEYSHVEDTMFFPKLRRQAKWMFVFLVLVFGLGFVVFGVGSGGGLGLGDLIKNTGTATGRPSAKDARKKISKGNLAAYKELAEAYRAENKPDDAISAGEQYVSARPKDYEFMRTLASDYEGKANTLRTEATAVQEDLNAKTGGSTFAIPPNTILGKALPKGRIDTEFTTYATQKLSEQYSGMQHAYSRATQLYQRVAAAQPEDVLLQLLLAQSAYQAQLVPVAIKAYNRVIKLAPDSAEAQQAREQVKYLRAQAQTSNVPAR